MKAGLSFIIVLTLLAGPAAGAVLPKPGAGDPRIQVVEFDPEEVVTLKVALGYSLTVELAADEKIETVSVGNSAVWQVTANHNADRLFIKPMQGAVDTNMTVTTGERVYNFDLKSAPIFDGKLPYLVRFAYDPLRGSPLEPSDKPRSTYHLGGARRLKPMSISDDGKATFISWGPNGAIPAIFIVDDQGRESLINGAMRGDRYVVDGIGAKFIFRLGDEEAFAVRRLQRGGK